MGGLLSGGKRLKIKYKVTTESKVYAVGGTSSMHGRYEKFIENYTCIKDHTEGRCHF
jgi:hypothetical protein